MSSEIPCPHCGLPVPKPRGGSWRPEDEADLEQAAAEEAEVPSISLLGSGSNDDTFAASPFGPRATPAEPDPILGSFAGLAYPQASGPAPSPPATGDFFSGIDLSAAPPSRPSAPREESGSDDAEGHEPKPRTSWPIVLLGSYASALTLALAWTLLGSKARDRGETERPAVQDNRVDPGQQAGLSRKVEAPAPIPADRVVGLGRPLAVGGLEVTPIEVRRQAVGLQRAGIDGKVQRKDGGKGALVLSLRLKNTSKDLVFAPLDQAFVRERGEGVVDSFIEEADGGRIYPYPLAVESEWSIVGQDFAELRPGESRVVAIASAPEAPGDDRGPFTWRVRLRTGIDRTDAIGVRWPSKP